MFTDKENKLINETTKYLLEKQAKLKKRSEEALQKSYHNITAKLTKLSAQVKEKIQNG